MIQKFLKPSRATRSGLNYRVKELAGLPYRTQVHQAWSFTLDQFHTHQTYAFRDIYQYIRRTIPYYRDSGEFPELPANELSAQELLSALPVLEKSVVKRYNEDLWPRPLPKLTWFHTTSGTSGTPLRIPATIWERAFYQRVQHEWWHRICGTAKPRTLFLTGFMSPSPTDGNLYWRDALSGNIYLSIYSLAPHWKRAIKDVIGNLKPQLIIGYASAVHQLAELFPEGIDSNKNERVAIVTSEILEPQWRLSIENSLCRKVYDFYSSTEMQHWITECDRGKLHINPLVGIVEIVDGQNRPTEAGQLGRVLITGLRQRSMPLIRYEIGDMAESTGFEARCSCGLQWPTIGAVQGRSEDMVVTKDGRQIGYLCFHATKNLLGIKEAQLIQRSVSEFDFLIVSSDSELENRAINESAIHAEITKRLQDSIDIRFQYLDAIPRGPNGKFKAVVVAFDDNGS